MLNLGRVELAVALLVSGLALGLGSLVLSPFIRRFRRSSAQADQALRQRPVWMVALLTALTLGVYLYIWVGRSWSDLTRMAVNLGMSSSSHLWAMAMEFDFFARVREHFRVINEQCALRDLP